MMEQEIVDYIIQAQKHGLSETEIKQNLLNVGWEADVVEASFVFVEATFTKKNFNEIQTLNSNKAEAAAANFTKNKPVISPIQQFNNTNITPNSTINEQGTSSYNAKQPKTYNKIAITLILCALIIGGFFVIFKYFTSPEKILAGYAKSQETKLYKAEYDFTYNDTTSKFPNSTTTGVTAYFKGDSKIDYTDEKNVSLHLNSNLGISSPNQVNLSYELILLNNILYFNIEKLDFLNSLLGKENVKWVKINLEDLNKYSQNNQSNSNYTQITNEFQKIWSNTKLINNLKFVGFEKINSVYTYHIQGSINSQELANKILESIRLIEKDGNYSQNKITSEQEQIIKDFFSKFTSKELDLWFGLKSFELAKLHLVLNAPTLVDLMNFDLNNYSTTFKNSNSNNRDAKRLADIRQYASSLEMYYNDNDSYPEADANGLPIDVSPKYLAMSLKAPNPPDKLCTDFYNTYWYTPSKEKIINGKKTYQDYSVTFCLGNPTGGYDAGIGKLTPSGINSNIPCPSTKENCVNTNPDNSENETENIKQTQFKSTLNINLNYYDIGKSFDLKSPDNSLDILNQDLEAEPK